MLTASEMKELSNENSINETEYKWVCEEIQKAAKQGKYEVYIGGVDDRAANYICRKLNKLGYLVTKCHFLYVSWD